MARSYIERFVAGLGMLALVAVSFVSSSVPMLAGAADAACSPAGCCCTGEANEPPIATGHCGCSIEAPAPELPVEVGEAEPAGSHDNSWSLSFASSVSISEPPCAIAARGEIGSEPHSSRALYLLHSAFLE